MSITIRLEGKSDYYKVEELTRDAFWNLYKPGCDEHYLVHMMRDHPDFIHDLAYIAEKDGQIIGSIMYTKSYVINENNEKLETITFGPLCVHPQFQREGVGTKLIEHTIEIVIQKGFPAIITLGDPHNYCKHGFKNGKDYNMSTMDGKYPLGLLILELNKGVFDAHKWKYQESNAYAIDVDKVENYDKKFPYKEKAYHYRQELFSMMIQAFVE